MNGSKEDLAEHIDDFKRLDSGKYLNRSNSGDFDIDRFNLQFEQYRERRKKEMRRNMRDRLDELNVPKERTPVYRESIGQIMIDTKDALFRILDDLLQYKFDLKTFTKDNRLFYIGLTLIFIAVFMYLYTIVIGDAHSNLDGGEVIDLGDKKVYITS